MHACYYAAMVGCLFPPSVSSCGVVVYLSLSLSSPARQGTFQWNEKLSIKIPNTLSLPHDRDGYCYVVLPLLLLLAGCCIGPSVSECVRVRLAQWLTWSLAVQKTHIGVVIFFYSQWYTPYYYYLYYTSKLICNEYLRRVYFVCQNFFKVYKHTCVVLNVD